MHEQLIQQLATATQDACARILSARIADLRASLEQACAVPPEFGWERKVAAHADFFNALADAAADPRLAPLFGQGAGFAYDLMITVGRAADGIVVNSRRRMLAHLRAGDADAAALEMERHLRTLQFMVRLSIPPGQRNPTNGFAVEHAAAELVTDASGRG
jgi:DNA-binding GntR family transcriptional regulator